MKTSSHSFLCGLLLACCTWQAWADDEALTWERLATMTVEERRALPLSEKLRLARPADALRQGGVLRAGVVSDENRLLGKKPGEPEVLIERVRNADGMGVLRAPGRDPGGDVPMAQNVPGEGVDGRESHAVPKATMPSPLSYTLDFPFRAFGKMLMGFDGWYYVCSASVVDRYFLLTAGHCIYNHDPNDDGSNADRQWADELWVFPAQTDRFDPIGRAEFPYGEARWMELHAYSGWTVNANLYYDQGFVRLDRPVGSRIGWMGYETNTAASGLNFSGYPVETPYVPPNTLVQYFGFEANNVTGYDTQRIYLSAHTWGGHSGGPVWRYYDNQRWLQGMNSSSNRAGSAQAARITNQVFNDLQAEIGEVRPEYLYPDLAEWTRVVSGPTKRLFTSHARPGESVVFQYSVGNLGFAPSGAISVDFYLVPYLWMQPQQGRWIGNVALPSLDQNSWYNPSRTVQVPGDMPPGYYHVAWRMIGENYEYPSTTSSDCTPRCNNNAYIDASQVRIAASWEWPDLRMSHFHAESQYLFRGNPVNLAATVENTGSFPAAQFWVGFYLSQDQVCNPEEDWLLGYYLIEGLDEFQTASRLDFPVDIPQNWPIGTATLCAFADDIFVVAESSESNNAAVLPVYIDGVSTDIFANGFEPVPGLMRDRPGR